MATQFCECGHAKGRHQWGMCYGSPMGGQCACRAFRKAAAVERAAAVVAATVILRPVYRDGSIGAGKGRGRPVHYVSPDGRWRVKNGRSAWCITNTRHAKSRELHAATLSGARKIISRNRG